MSHIITNSYSAMTVKQLKDICRTAKHIYAGYSKHTRKADLVAFMIQAVEKWERESVKPSEDVVIHFRADDYRYDDTGKNVTVINKLYAEGTEQSITACWNPCQIATKWVKSSHNSKYVLWTVAPACEILYNAAQADYYRRED